MAVLQSNTLLLVNVSDGDASENQTVFIKYSSFPDGGNKDGSDLLDSPVGLSGIIYMGIFVGSSVSNNPDNYTWTKYEGESQYIDIRYSDDGGKTFTEGLGITAGKWIGIYITKDSNVQEETYEPKVEDYSWSLIQADVPNNFSYYLETNFDNCTKYYNSDLQTFSYSPTTLNFTSYLLQNGIKSKGANLIKCSFYYEEIKENGEKELVLYEDQNSLYSSVGELNIDLTKTPFPTLNFSTLIIKVYDRDRLIDDSDPNNIVEAEEVITSVKTIDYGTTDSIAKLALNANNIVASMKDTKVVFGENGLTINNGGFRIFNNTDKDNLKLIFNVSDEGNLFLSGEIESSKGRIGNWLINEYGLYSVEDIPNSEDKYIIGLHASDSVLYENSSIRFYAGTSDKNNNHDYKFLVTKDGSLYANQANITGSVIVTDGYVKNNFYIGEKNGIIFNYNSEKEESFIGSYHYSSGDLGYGWQIRSDGSADFNNITARGKIRSSLFEYNKISSVGGSLYIAPTIYVEDYSSSIEEISISTLETQENPVISFQTSWILPYSTLTNLNGHTWNKGDFIKIDGEIVSESSNDFVKYEISGVDATIDLIKSIDNSTTEITITFSTNQFKQGQIKDKKFIPGTMLILYGTSDNKKGLYLTAAGDNSPYIDVYDDTNESESIPAARLGNLTGIRDFSFSEDPLEGYGLYSSNAYLRGKLVLPQAGISDQVEVGYNGGDLYTTINQENPEGNSVRLWAGGKQPKTGEEVAPFIVTQDGSLYAQKGIFKGVVKAVNSEFQGSIKAAGIVIDNPDTPNIEEASKDHFFVAYKDSPETFDDYVLNIDSTGLSVWEGGLRAYSDYSWEDSSQNPPLKKVDSIYGYDSLKNNSPTPYFYLVDDGVQEEFNGRIVSHKGHFLQIKQNENKYSTNSVIIDEGIWLTMNELENFSTLEKDAFQHANEIGFSVRNQKDLSILSKQNIIFDNSGTVYINPQEEEITTEDSQIKLLIHGPVKISNEKKASLLLGNIELKEFYLNDNIEGLNFFIIEEKE